MKDLHNVRFQLTTTHVANWTFMQLPEDRKRRACLAEFNQHLHYGFQRQMQEQELAR